ncbi:MAG: hypothetical protein P1S60_09105 [Anaerolineae bacterium]|nr:hypothetical protein [Anaerolineae bacterium]
MPASKIKFASLVKAPMVHLLLIQLVALILYPLPFFQQAPQAAVLPPTLLILLIIAVLTTNTGSLSLEAGRASLVFIQGINVVVRIIMLFPNLKTPQGSWNWSLLLMQIISIALSWTSMVVIERRPLKELNILRTLREGE